MQLSLDKMRSGQSVLRHFSTSEESSVESLPPTSQISLPGEDESVGVSTMNRSEVDSFTPKHSAVEVIVDEIKAPDDFVDPLNANLMKGAQIIGLFRPYYRYFTLLIGKTNFL